MRLTVMAQMAKELGSGGSGNLASEAARQLQRVKWFLWHGNLFRALQVVEDLEEDLQLEEAGPEQRKLLRAIREFDTYLRANGAWIPNHRERRRNRETISSGFIESTINQVVSKRMVKRQQMRWTPRGPTCCSRSAPECSTTSSRPPSAAGIRASHRRQPGAGRVTSHALP